MRIVRIEHSEATRIIAGKEYPAGPYAGSVFINYEHPDYDTDEYLVCDHECMHEWSESFSWDTSRHRPMPRHRPEAHHFFGFNSVEAMRDWFLGEFRRIERFGFVASVYEVPDQHGILDRAQVMFVMNEATKIGSTRPTNYKRLRAWLEG